MEKQNPNSRKLPIRDRSNISWSELPLDLLNPVFERLSFPNFQRAKSVCSSWFSTSKQSVPKNLQIPWLILFPVDDDNNNSCTLFNPEEKDKLYKRKDMGLKFSKSVCIANYGNWLLMRERRYNHYIVNLFTNERINLLPTESQLGKTKVERTLDDWFLISNNLSQNKCKGIDICSPVFWIDEETKDYFVTLGFGHWCVVYSKKGDTSWNQIPEISNCYHMVYKDHMLYFLSYSGITSIFDLPGEIPQVNLHCHRPNSSCGNLVVTVTGDVLNVEILLRPNPKIWIFRVYKVIRGL